MIVFYFWLMTVISEYLNVPYRSVFMNTSMVSSNRRISSE